MIKNRTQVSKQWELLDSLLLKCLKRKKIKMWEQASTSGHLELLCFICWQESILTKIQEIKIQILRTSKIELQRYLPTSIASNIPPLNKFFQKCLKSTNHNVPLSMILLTQTGSPTSVKSISAWITFIKKMTTNLSLTSATSTDEWKLVRCKEARVKRSCTL